MNVLKSIVTLLLSLLFVACSQNGVQEDILVVGTSADNPVFEHVYNGKVVGLDIDVIEAVGQKLNKKVVIKNLDFTGLFPALSSGNVDMVIAGITPSEERRKHFDFSNNYISTKVGILCRADINSLLDLKGKTIGAQLGSTWEGVAKEILIKVPTSRLRTLSNNLILVEELKSGAVDAVVLEEVQIKKFIENNSKLKKLTLENYGSDFAIVLRKNSPLVQKIDQALGQLKTEGVIDEITAKWLGD